jgi:peroxiredoxin Q/BCP
MFMKTIILLLSIVVSTAISNNPVKVGEKVPDFDATDDKGTLWKLSEQRNDYLVIYFYPAAFTGGCTKQACSYRDQETAFKLLKTSIIGISGDSWENLARFKEYHNLNFTMLSDEDGSITRLFGVPLTEGGTVDMEIDGKPLSLKRGVTAARWTFILDIHGKVIYRDNHVNAETDSDTVLKYIFTYNQRRSCTNF